MARASTAQEPGRSAHSCALAHLEQRAHQRHRALHAVEQQDAHVQVHDRARRGIGHESLRRAEQGEQRGVGQLVHLELELPQVVSPVGLRTLDVRRGDHHRGRAAVPRREVLEEGDHVRQAPGELVTQRLDVV